MIPITLICSPEYVRNIVFDFCSHHNVAKIFADISDTNAPVSSSILRGVLSIYFVSSIGLLLSERNWLTTKSVLSDNFLLVCGFVVWWAFSWLLQSTPVV